MGIKVLVTISTILVLINGEPIPKENYSNANKYPSLKVCGKVLDSLDEAIVGGKRADLGAYPWMTNIGYREYGKSQQSPIEWNCGGTLITDRHILTAAHCIPPSPKRMSRQKQWVLVSVLLGDLDINPNVTDGATPKMFDIDKAIPHEKYDITTKENDIAIIKIKGKVDFTNLIRPICLPPPSWTTKDFVGEFPTIAGWGNLAYYGRVSKDTHLNHAIIKVENLEGCRRNLTATSALQNVIIDDRVICAGSTGKDSCTGDSGGPLKYMYQSSKPPQEVLVNWFQIGVIAYGYRCAEDGYPGVYTRVPSFLSWIDKNVEF